MRVDRALGSTETSRIRLPGATITTLFWATTPGSLPPLHREREAARAGSPCQGAGERARDGSAHDGAGRAALHRQSPEARRALPGDAALPRLGESCRLSLRDSPPRPNLPQHHHLRLFGEMKREPVTLPTTVAQRETRPSCRYPD